MQKTNLGISVGLLGAAVYLMAFFGGYIPLILLGGYVLLHESNEWLRRAAVKAGILTVLFAVAVAILNLLPNAIGFIDSVVSIFKGSLYWPIVNKIVTALTDGLNLMEKVLFLMLGLKALNQGTVAIGFVDRLVNKFAGRSE